MNEELTTIEPQLNEPQMQEDLTALNQEAQPLEPEEERYAGLLSSFTRQFTTHMARNKTLQQEASHRGEKAFLKRQADQMDVEPRATDIQTTDIKQIDVDEPYQMDFDLISDEEDVQKALAQLNEVNRDAIQTQRRTVVPDVELRQLAADLSSDEETIRTVLKLKPGEILPPEYILSMKDTMSQSGKRLADLSEKIVGGNATDQEKIAFHKQWEFHSQFTKQFMGVRAEYGRGLRAMGVDAGQSSLAINDLMTRMSAGGLDTNTMAQQILLAKDTRSLNKVIQSQQGFLSKTSDAFSELFISSILSGIQTHIVNTTGNALKAITMPLDTAVASMLKFGDAEIKGGEAFAQIRGMMEANWEGLETALRVLKTGKAYGDISKVDVDYNKAISANAFGIKDGTTLATVVDKFGQIVRLPTDNLMGAEDAFFKVISERGKTRQLAHRQAQEKGLQGQEYTDFIAYAMDNPSPDMKRQATEAGLEATYQTPLGEAGRAIQNVRSSVPGGNFVMPFVKTPLNILYEGFVERTPLSVFTKKWANAFQKGGADKQMVVAKMVVGTAFNSAFITAAMNGTVTGATPKDPKIRQQWKDNGVEPNSFVFEENGKKSYVSFDRLEPFNSIIGLYANINQVIQMSNYDAENPEASKEMEKLAGGLALALAEATVNKTFMKGVGDLLEVMNDPTRYTSSYVSNLIGGFVPLSGALKNVTKSLDPIVRDAQGIVDKIAKNMPGLSEEHVPVLDNFGKPVTFNHNLAPAFWKFGVDGTEDKVYQEVARITDVTKQVPINKPKLHIGSYKLSAKEYHYYTDRATNTERDGLNFYGKIKEVIGTSEYQNATDYVKAEYLSYVRNAYYEAAKAELMEEYPHIRKYDMDVKEYKLKKLLGE